MLVERGSSLDVIFKEETADGEPEPTPQATSTSLINECVHLGNMVLFMKNEKGDIDVQDVPKPKVPKKHGFGFGFGIFKPPKAGITIIIITLSKKKKVKIHFSRGIIWSPRETLVAFPQPKLVESCF